MTHHSYTSLTEVKNIIIDYNLNQLVLPIMNNGKIKLIGTDAFGVIDLEGNVYIPLVKTTVKIFIEHCRESGVETKEFIVSVNGKFVDEGIELKSTIIPTIQQWHGIEGMTSITNNTRLVIGDSRFTSAVDQYKKDLEKRGLSLVKGTKSASQRIEFNYIEGKGYGFEGYGISIKDDVIVIEAETNTGVLYATRTLLQIGEVNLQNGEIKDYPTFSHRGFMLDTGRKFVPYKIVMNILDNMAYYKLNDLQLHLNDNYIFLKEHIINKNLTREEQLDYVLKNATTGFRLESNFIGKDGTKLTSDDYYTNEEFQNIIKRANHLGINLVPEIDTPGHALSFVKIRPDLMYQGEVGNHHDVERVAMLDLSFEKYDEAFKFVTNVYDELLEGPLKGVSTIHVGTDEYYGDSESYRRYANDIIQYIKSKGLNPRIWGSLSMKKGSTPVDFEGVEVDIWSIPWQNPSDILRTGAKIINITDTPTYSVPSGLGDSKAYGDYNDYPRVFEAWEPHDFRTANSELFEASNPNIIGGSFAIWNDNIDLHETGITSIDMFNRMMVMIEATAEKTWLSTRRVNTSFKNRLKLDTCYIYAPSTDIELRKDSALEYNLSGEDIKYVQKNCDGIVFDKNTRLSMKYDYMPINSTLQVEVTLTGEGEQIFSTDGKSIIYLSDKDGKVAYTFEQFMIQFDAVLVRGKKYEVTIVSKEQSTELFIDGRLQERIKQVAHPKLKHTTFIKPIGIIGGFEGVLHSLKLY